MTKSQSTNNDENRSLSNEQIEKMTPEDFLVAFFHSQFVEEPVWVHILAQQITRVLATYSDLFEMGLDKIQVDKDISDARRSILLRTVIGIKDEVE